MGDTRGLIPDFLDGKARGHSCCCGKPACKYLAIDFRSVNDIRGSFASFPFVVIDGGAHTSKDDADRTFKMKKAALFLLHLGVKEGDVEISRNTKVAWHHFDPVAIKCLAYDAKKKKYNCPDVIPGFFVGNLINYEHYNSEAAVEAAVEAEAEAAVEAEAEVEVEAAVEAEVEVEAEAEVEQLEAASLPLLLKYHSCVLPWL
jgi:hypothetical protein